MAHQDHLLAGDIITIKKHKGGMPRYHDER